MAEATAKRCQGLPLVLAVQDTTSLDYTTRTDTVGLGPLEHPKHRGLLVHSALAVNPQGGVPMGIVSQQSGLATPKPSARATNVNNCPSKPKRVLGGC